MTPMELLEEQHREVEDLFEQFEEAKGPAQKRKIFAQIADKLAVHAKIEEVHFYPAVKSDGTEDMLLEAVEEHLSVKRIIADLLDLDAKDETFEAKVLVLKEQIEHHVEEEEEELFPKAYKLLDKETQEALLQEMVATQNELEEEGNPREAVPAETERAAPV